MIPITVVIPVYNMEKYLPQCLDSILRQKLKNIEIFCINDGSTDRSAEILQDYQKRDARITVRTQQNCGVSAARNAGIQAARGEYIAFMDPDDYYPDAGALEDLWNAAAKSRAVICGGSFSEDHGSWKQHRFSGDESRYCFEQEGWISYRDYQYDYGYHRFLYKRDFLMEHHLFFPPYIRFQDPPFFVRAMLLAERFYALPRITYCYRMEHQTIDWTYEKAVALLKGLIDNLRLSAEEGLWELHRMTAGHLILEYADIFSDHLYQENEELLQLLFEAEHLMDRGILEENHLEQGIRTIIKNGLKSCDRDKEEEYRSQYKRQAEAVYSSWNYRVGAAVLFLPKKIMRLFEIFHKG